MHRHHVFPVSTVLLVAANLLLPVAILIFATGFFPYKPFLPGLARHEELDGYESSPHAPFDKLVFMVVDALRRCVADRHPAILLFAMDNPS